MLFFYVRFPVHPQSTDSWDFFFSRWHRGTTKISSTGIEPSYVLWTQPSTSIQTSKYGWMEEVVRGGTSVVWRAHGYWDHFEYVYLNYTTVSLNSLYSGWNHPSYYPSFHNIRKQNTKRIVLWNYFLTIDGRLRSILTDGDKTEVEGKVFRGDSNEKVWENSWEMVLESCPFPNAFLHVSRNDKDFITRNLSLVFVNL